MQEKIDGLFLHSVPALAFTVGHIQMEAKWLAFSSERWSEVVSHWFLSFSSLIFGTLVYFFPLSVWNSIVALCLTAFLHLHSHPLSLLECYTIYFSLSNPNSYISICLKINLNKIYVFGISYRIRRLKTLSLLVSDGQNNDSLLLIVLVF